MAIHDMATIHRQSLREESERIKAEFSKLILENKVNSEMAVLFQSLLMLVNLLMAIFLEKNTKKTSKNSSKPSSQTEKDESSLTEKGTNGKGKAESDAVASNTRTIETVTVAPVTRCDVCGQDLSDAPCEHIERRTKIDILFEKVVEHVDAEIKYCDICDTTVKGKFPLDMHSPLQYGNGLKAYVITLLVCQMISLNRVQKLVKSIIGVIIAESTLLKFVFRLYLALESWESGAIDQPPLSAKLSPFLKTKGGIMGLTNGQKNIL